MHAVIKYQYLELLIKKKINDLNMLNKRIQLLLYKAIKENP